MKKLTLSIIRIIGKKRINRVLKAFSAFTRKMAHFAHKLQMKFEWKVLPHPEWFDHNCDQFYLFRETRNPLWVERGVFGLLGIKQGADVLELCCGDGFNASHFYSIRANKIQAVDFDKDAIPHAKKYNKTSNVTFSNADIRYEMPEGMFDNIIWDAAIEHFTPDEIGNIMQNISRRLKENGILTGYTIVEQETKQLSHHEYEFKSKEDLKRFLVPHFKNVKVFETIYPNRHNLYFYASNGVLPFDSDWPAMTVK